MYKSKEMYRPCFVNGKKALFHRWSDYSLLVAESPLKGGHPAGVVKGTVAIVKFEDGSVKKVDPSIIRFVTSKLIEYDWLKEV